MSQIIPSFEEIKNSVTSDSTVQDEIVVNKEGGKQSKIEGRFTELPPIALAIVSKVMEEGSIRYPRESDGSPNWYKIDTYSNLDHAGLHFLKFLQYRNKYENSYYLLMLEELAHAAARTLMALEQFVREKDE